MIKRIYFFVIVLLASTCLYAQINTEQVMRIGQNALYFKDYLVSIQYFNLAIQARPDQAKPYYFRAIAKLYLDDFLGAEQDATLAIERNPFLKDVWEIRAVARQNMGKNQEAIADYEKALQETPGNKQILYNKAMAHISEKEYSTSETIFGELISKDANNDRAYSGRAQLWLIQGDTAKAIADLDTAIIINKNEYKYYSHRAYLNAITIKDYPKAIDDMDEAIKLHQNEAEFYIFRAQLKYNNDNYDGALDDYSTAIQIDPQNHVAHYNRAILRSEINDINRAIDDFSVVLHLDPNDYRTLYNRAILYRNIHDYKNALADVNKVIEVMPDFPVAYFLRFEINQKMGNDRRAMQDYDHAIALVKKLSSSKKTRKIGDPFAKAIAENNPNVGDVVDNQFMTLLPVEPENSSDPIYNSKDLMGALQDREIKIEPEPMFVLTYYVGESELQIHTIYVKEVDEINEMRMLRFDGLAMANRHQMISTDSLSVTDHIESIEYYNSYLSTHNPRAIDYFGRALDFFLLRNNDAAIADADRAIALAPDFALAYFLRAVAQYENIYITEALEHSTDNNEAKLGVVGRNAILAQIVDDLNAVISINPNMAVAHYNKGNALMAMQNFTEAINAYNKAISLDPSMGEAYFNRGYVYLKIGNIDAATADISKSGELGIVSAYNLLKTISKEQHK